MALPLHSRLRQKFKDIFFKIVQVLWPNKFTNTLIDPETIHSVFVIRINYRIGNMLMVTPLIQALEKELPHARIDLLVGAAYTKVFFEGFKQIDNIYDFPRKLLKNPLSVLRYIKRIRAKKYDLLINLNAGSSSDRIATLLSRAEIKLGFCLNNSWLPINHCVELDPALTHEALKPLALMNVFKPQHPFAKTLSIALNTNEKNIANGVLTQLLNQHELNNHTKIVGLFRNARNEKKIENDWWLQLVDALKKQQPDLVFIDILSPDVPEPLVENMVSYAEKNLRSLGAFLSQLDVFICADTGPMHLACASGVSTIALFKDSSPLLYGPLGDHDLSLVIKDRTTAALASDILLHLKDKVF